MRLKAIDLVTFLPIVHTKTIKNAKENGGFENCLESGDLKTHRFENAVVCARVKDFENVDALFDCLSVDMRRRMF